MSRAVRIGRTGLAVILLRNYRMGKERFPAAARILRPGIEYAIIEYKCRYWTGRDAVVAHFSFDRTGLFAYIGPSCADRYSRRAGNSRQIFVRTVEQMLNTCDFRCTRNRRKCCPVRHLAEWRNGRRWGFKIPCPIGRVGSNPTSATYIQNTEYKRPGLECVLQAGLMNCYWLNEPFGDGQ